MKRVLIAITTAETVCQETMQSIYELEKPEDVQTELRIHHSYNVADGRNELVQIMYNEGFDYIFFVDSDVVLPKNALVDLYNMQWYMCVGTYPRKEMQTFTDQDPWTTLYWHNDNNKTKYCPYFMPFSVLKPGIIVPVDGCGLGCALLSRQLFDLLPYPWFVFAHEGNPSDENHDEYCIGEDLYFCRSVIRADIQPWAHGSVICGHVGKMIYKFPELK